MILTTGAADARRSWRGKAAALARAVVFAVAVQLALPALPALAETPAAPATGGDGATVSVKDLESLVSTVEDEGKRKALVAQLKALIAAQKGRAATSAEPTGLSGVLATLSERVRLASADLVETATLMLDLPTLWRWAADTAADPEARARGLAGLLQIVAVLGLGALAGWLIALALRRPRRALDARVRRGFLVRLALALGSTLLDLLPLAAFAAVAYGLLPVLGPSASVRLIALALINASLVARGIAILARMALAPASETRRLLPIASESAAYTYVWIKRFAVVVVYGYFSLETALLLGLPLSLYSLFRNLNGLLLTAMLAIFILQVRRPVARWVGGAPDDAPSGMRLLRARLADIWHILMIGYVVVGFIAWALRIHGGSSFVLRGTLLTLLILGLAQLVVSGLRRLVEWLFAIGTDMRERYPMLQARADRYLPAVQGVLRWVVYAFVVLAILQAWGVDSFAWLATPDGREVVGRLFSIAVVVVGALLVWEMISAVIERRLSRADDSRRRGMSGARLRTLLPFARRALLVALIVMVGLIVLSEIGVDTAPLIAGAGVVGIAIGFGAQSLVKDVITGLFILVEDSVAVGDVAELGGRTGVVEGMSMRSVRLRDGDGHLHTVPFSEVTTVRNMTRDFSYAVFNIGVAYRENVDDVIAVMREVAESLRQDAGYAAYILEPLDVAGLDKFGDSAVVIMARLKVLPAQQWRIGREYNRRLKIEFDRRGIEMPFPQRALWFGTDKEGQAPALRARLEGGPAEALPEAERSAGGDGGEARKSD